MSAERIEEILELLREHVLDRHYGKYRGFVVDNEDPLGIGRIRAKVPALLREIETGWALPCAPYGGMEDQGFFAVPDVGAGVWMEFEGGNLERPIWTGTFWAAPSGRGFENDEGAGSAAETPHTVDDAEPTVDSRILRSREGHTLELEDGGEKRARFRHGEGHGLDLNGSQEALLEAATILLGSAQASEALVLGNAFMQFFNQHTHPTGVGPSGPPTQPMTSAQHLSRVTSTD